MADIMDDGLLKCPVCGKENKYTRYSEWGFGTVEQHYYCPRCTYFVEQCYSPWVEGISTDCPEEYLERAKELKLRFYEQVENWCSRQTGTRTFYVDYSADIILKELS